MMRSCEPLKQGKVNSQAISVRKHEQIFLVLYNVLLRESRPLPEFLPNEMPMPLGACHAPLLNAKSQTIAQFFDPLRRFKIVPELNCSASFYSIFSFSTFGCLHTILMFSFRCSSATCIASDGNSTEALHLVQAKSFAQ